MVELTSFPGAISQIIINLIMNSLTHGFSDSKSGKIQIVVSDILEEYDEVLLIYSDNGKGIEEKNLSKIFDPFYTSNRGGGNTGLGMHITYNLIVQKLKGAIAINSLPTVGAEFYIRLPKTVVEVTQKDSS
jgi:signal transduction histidine kinase